MKRQSLLASSVRLSCLAINGRGVMGPIVNAPIILDVGKTSRKSIKQIKRGQGKLMSDVQDAMAEVTASLGEQANGQQLVPVVLLYRRKSRRNKKSGGLLPLFL